MEALRLRSSALRKPSIPLLPQQIRERGISGHQIGKEIRTNWLTITCFRGKQEDPAGVALDRASSSKGEGANTEFLGNENGQCII